MCTKFKLLFVLLLLFFQAKAQDFTVSGVVIERGANLRVALAEIKNKRTGNAVGSNDMGIFSIKARIGDTLLVTKRNFNDLTAVVWSNKDLVLYINKGTMLNEVLVTGQTKRQAYEEMRQQYRNKGSFYEGKPPIGALFGSPLTFFYELFGKTPARARRFNRMYKAEMQNSEVDQLFNKRSINEQTGLTGEALEDFLVKYRPSYDQAKNWNVYDAIKWINQSYKKYSDTAGKVKSQK